ncbi:MAG: peptidylprolyl isomerase [Marinilabiliales bacterium]
MKKTGIVIGLLTIIFLGNVFSQKDNVLLTINGQDVTKDEFVRIYKKNNNNTALDKKSIEEYLDLFINFKLKVIEAENLGMDTVASFKKELAGYRKQLVKPYLVDSSVDEQLIQEAFERMQYDIRASHILVRLPQDAKPEDTLAAYQKIMKARTRIINGEDFAKVAKEVSEDESVQSNGGDLGYFTVFQMVYPFETMAYNTKVGEVSMPFRTRFGYHILKVIDKRPAQGEVKVAHIMVSVPADADEQKQKDAEAKINDIYQKLQNGEDFAELAKTYSDDKGTAQKGGELNWFGTGRMVPEFEKAAFEIQKIGDFSKPVRTNFGWHIIKLLDKRDIGSFDDKKAYIKKRLSRDARAEKSRQAVINKLKKEYKLNVNQKNVAEFYSLIDSNYFAGNWVEEKFEKLNKPLITFADTTITQKDFAEILKKRCRKQKPVDSEVYINKVLNEVIDDAIIKYEEDHLEEKYDDFRYLMKEYHDGILLFDLTDKMVWSKAVKDTVGLKEFYEKHKNNYMWSNRVEASIVKYKDNDVLNSLKKLIDKKPDLSAEQILETINKKDSANTKIIETNKFVKGDNDFVDKFIFNANGFNESTKLYADEANKMALIIHQRIAPTPKTLDEARGLVTADYQNELEKKWVEELRNKYDIKVNKEVLSTIK